MTKRKVLIALAILASLFIAIILIGFAGLISALPSPKEIAKKLPSRSSQTPSKELQSQKSASATQSTSSLSSDESAPLETSEEKAIREKKEQEAKNEALFEKLLSEDASDIRVCDNLGRTPLTAEELKRERSFDEMMSGRDDALNEAFRAPILNVFKDPNLQSFIDEVKVLKDKTENQTAAEKESWLQKAGFYSRAAYTGARVLARKSEFEHMGNQSAHLMALARLSALKPELAAGGQLQSLCRSIESRAKSGEPSDLVSDRRELVEIFRSAGVDPKSVGFDPSKWIHFSMKIDKSNLAFNLTDEEQPEAKTSR